MVVNLSTSKMENERRVARERLDDMRSALQKHALYSKYSDILSDDYLLVVMSQKKRGKIRTFDYARKKLETVLDNMNTYDFREIFSHMPKHLIESPMTYMAGYDNDGVPILVTDLNRMDMSKLQESGKYQNALMLASILAVVRATGATQVRSILLAHNLSVPVTLVRSFLQIVASFTKKTLVNTPDRTLRGYYFISCKLSKLASFIMPLLPANVTRRLALGSAPKLRTELLKVCSAADDVLPPELGGNVTSVEQNFEFIVYEDGHIDARIMELSESGSGGRIIFKNEPWHQTGNPQGIQPQEQKSE